jgi:multisubunit Na+/H+ antiporter MnhB subunit
MRTLTEDRRPTATGDVDFRAPRLDTRQWLNERIAIRPALVVGASWYVLYLVVYAIEPASDHPDAFPAWLSATLEVTLLGLLGLMAAGLVAQRRWGLVASMSAAVFLVGLVVACPVTGHHSFGAWWYGQMACAIGLVAITGAALRRA